MQKKTSWHSVYTCSTSSAQGHNCCGTRAEKINQEFLKLESLKNRSQEVVELLQPWESTL